jgi:hypothetical protein
MAECRETPAGPEQPVLVADSGAIGSLPAAQVCAAAGAAGTVLYPEGIGRRHRMQQRSVSLLQGDGPATMRAALPLVVRVEDAAAWHTRNQRRYWLLGGVLVLLAAAHLWRRAGPIPLTAAATLLLAAVVTSGCGVAPLARLGLLNAPDVAAAVLLGTWLALLPALRQRLFLAGALLLVPLALAQPLLRPAAGDEAYHLELLQSLRDDQDLAIANNIDTGNPAEAIYLRHGDRLIHSPLPALLTLPGYLVLGHAGVLVLTALMVAGGAALVARRSRQLGHGRRTTAAAWLMVLLSYPALTFATQLWPGSLAILLSSVLLVAAARPSIIGSALAAALAIMVKVRLGLIALPLAATAAVRRFRLGLPALAAATVAAAVAVAAVLGSPLGRHRLSELRPHNLERPLSAVWGLLWDGAGGLAFAAPLWLVGLALIPVLWRRGEAGERGLVIAAGLTLAALAPRGEWYGGGSPPARYLVPLLPLVQLALAEAIRHRYWRRWLRLVLPWAVVAAWVAATRPLWLFNQVDGGWWLADRLARTLGVAARSCFPTLLRSEPATWVVPLLLVACAVWWAARLRRGAVAMTIGGLALVVVVAAARPEVRVHAEDPQVLHLSGTSEPPPGTFYRARRGIYWRLPPGGTIEIPWRPPPGQVLYARLKVDGPPGTTGRLLNAWDSEPRQGRKVRGRFSHEHQLSPPPDLAGGCLHLTWVQPDNQPPADLLIDMVLAKPP